MTHLITGATGDVGSKVVKGLIACGERPRVFVRDEEKARSLFGDRVDVFVGNLAEAASLTPALEGVDGLFLVNSGPQIPVLDEMAAMAAKAAAVRHLVKLSSMDVQQGLAIGAWHERGEAAIRASGIGFTFVQPTGFMSNLLAWARSIRTEGVVRAATGEGRRAFIHSEDIAAVSVEALTTRNYEGQSLPITGPEALTFGEVTRRDRNRNWKISDISADLGSGGPPAILRRQRIRRGDRSPRGAVESNSRRASRSCQR